MKSAIYALINEYVTDVRPMRTIGNIKSIIKRDINPNIENDVQPYSGSTFQESLYKYLNDIKTNQLCPICNLKNVRFITLVKGYDTVCSKKCRCVEVYGVDNPMKSPSVVAKFKATCVERFGGVTPLYSENTLNKIKATCLERYGVDHYSKTGKHLNAYADATGYSSPLSNPDVRAKILKTNRTRYHGNAPSCDPKIALKISNTRKDRASVYKTGEGQMIAFFERAKMQYTNFEFLFDVDTYIGTHSNTEYARYDFKCNRCDTSFSDFFDKNGIRCPKCDKTPQSKPELELQEWLQSLGVVNIETNNRKLITPLEVDIYLPDYNLAIEFNGLYWHSEHRGNKNRSYHMNKTKLCEKVGVKLIHIFEDEWMFKQHIVKSRIINALKMNSNKIYGRKCTIEVISPSIKKAFLNSNHIQGDCRSSYNIGAYYDGVLVSVMTFGRKRYDKSNGFELIRFATQCETSILGIGSKMITYAKRNHIKDAELLTYCDLRWGDGGGYIAMGFKYKHTSPPNFFYVSGYTRHNRLKFQKHKLADMLDTFDPTLTAWDNMKNNNFDRIWDCGCNVYTY